MEDIKNKIELPEELKNLIKTEGVDLAELEKIGAALLTFGYSNYIRAAQLDILELNGMNRTGLRPSSITVYGQQFVLLGYLTLYTVSSKRLEERRKVTSIVNRDIDLSPFEAIQFSYLVSVLVNALRLEAFIEIDKNDPSGELIQ